MESSSLAIFNSPHRQHLSAPDVVFPEIAVTADPVISDFLILTQVRLSYITNFNLRRQTTPSTTMAVLDSGVQSLRVGLPWWQMGIVKSRTRYWQP